MSLNNSILSSILEICEPEILTTLLNTLSNKKVMFYNNVEMDYLYSNQNNKWIYAIFYTNWTRVRRRNLPVFCTRNSISPTLALSVRMPPRIAPFAARTVKRRMFTVMARIRGADVTSVGRVRRPSMILPAPLLTA